MSIELLQEIGLNKYEAEAYYALLTHGPLTGYELGKRSQVPLSRCYDTLERLSQRGLALVQPGDPARYLALEPTLFLGQVRANMEHTLHALSDNLAALPESEKPGEFWVVRGRWHILARAQSLCATATQSIQFALPETALEEISGSLAQARSRGCDVSLLTGNAYNSAILSLLVDGREALLGTLTPEESCQAIYSANPALLTVLARAFLQARPRVGGPPEEQSAPEEADWLAWEQRKQWHLWRNRFDRNIA